jgi:hypothetical protein
MSEGSSTTVRPSTYPSYADYSAWFDNEYARFKIPDGCVECGPFRGPTTIDPSRPPWQLRWWLVFSDGLYLSCTEYFDPRSGAPSSAGHLSQFSYHYGKHPGRTDKRGCPKHSSGANTLLRIDFAPDYGYHIHFQGVDHIPQSDLTGKLVIKEQTMFDFIRRILFHRETGTPINECFNFEVL